jgi:threonine aldolase
MRYIAAQFEAVLGDDLLWLETARHANRMAALLAAEAATIPGVRLSRVPEANEVFARLPAAAVPLVQARCFFYEWDPEPATDDEPQRPTVEVRWVCSWDTTEADVRRLALALRAELLP